MSRNLRHSAPAWFRLAMTSGSEKQYNSCPRIFSISFFMVPFVLLFSSTKINKNFIRPRPGETKKRRDVSALSFFHLAFGGYMPHSCIVESVPLACPTTWREMRTAKKYLPQSSRVLCGKYSSTLRRVLCGDAEAGARGSTGGDGFWRTAVRHRRHARHADYAPQSQLPE